LTNQAYHGAWRRIFRIDYEAVMNKPAPKEPSMDEILSSIRQIIADDDAAAAPRKPAAAAPAPVRAMPAAPAPEPEEPAEPLALTAEQMLPDELNEEPEQPAAHVDIADDADDALEAAGEPELVDPDDVAFDGEEPAAPEPVRTPPPVVLPPAARQAPPRPAPSAARTAPMPDPTLSRDIAEELLEPATNAAVKHTFAKLNNVSLAGSGLTLDSLMREMLRPMLKEWLDENLPSVVERMVEKEISRVSRGE
jgi:uncharacterized protein